MTSVLNDDHLLISGTCAPEFTAVKETFVDNFRRRGEIGAAVCVYKNGKKVIDLWGGHKDIARTEPWDKDTIVIMNSLAKSMSSLCMHILIDRGKVDFDAPVADYWPEFAQAGKKGCLSATSSRTPAASSIATAPRPVRGSAGRSTSRRWSSRSRPGRPAPMVPTIRSISAICSAK